MSGRLGTHLGLISVAVAATALSMPATARAKAPDRYLVSVQIKEGDKLIASPRLLALSGASARATVSGLYDVSVTAAPDTKRAGNVLLSYSITLSSSSEGVSNRRTQTSTFSIKEGQLAVLDLAQPGGATGVPTRVELSVVGADG